MPFNSFSGTFGGQPVVTSVSLAQPQAVYEVDSPSLWAQKMMKLVNVGTKGLVAQAEMQAASFSTGRKIIDTEFNGMKLGTLVANVANVTKLNDVDEHLVNWEIKEVNAYSDANRIPVEKTSVLSSIWVDNRGTYYGRIVTTYDVAVWVGSNINFWNNARADPFKLQTVVEYVVIGFTYDEGIENIFIPNSVKVDDIVYPVREIWGGAIYARTTSNPELHALSMQELSKADNVLNVPAAIVAPHIEKISLKRRIVRNQISIFSGCVPMQVQMPNLRSIIGAGCHARSPVFCSNNSSSYYTSKLSFPALKSIKNCMFACQLAALKEIELPSLESIEETIFLMNCPMITELSLPHIIKIKGCDFFCANDFNLERLHFTRTVAFMPHDVEPAAKFEGEQLLRQTLALLGLSYQPYLVNDTISMGYFCNGCIRLMNASSKIAPVSTSGTSATTYAAPLDNTTNGVDVTRGIDFIYEYKNEGHHSVLGHSDCMSIDDNSYYGRDAIMNLDQFTRRQTSKTAYTSTTGVLIDFGDYHANVTGAKPVIPKYFFKEPTYKAIVADKANEPAIAGTYIVCAIDPRTSLMNTMITPLSDSTTNTHAYSVFNNELLMTVQPDSALYDYPDMMYNALIAPNQCYNSDNSTN